MDIGGWLRELGLGQYEQLFRDNAIDTEILPELTDSDLERLGVLLGHRRKLLKAIAALREGQEPSAKGVAARSRHEALKAERRQLTVMFIDLVGSTALSTRLDPEEMHLIAPLRVGRGYRLGMAYSVTDLRILKDCPA